MLLAAAGWVLTGRFSHIGSDRAAAAEEAPAPQPAATSERTVLVARPDDARYSRSIRISGRTEPDKTSVLAARESGVISALAATDGQYVSTGSVLLSLEGPEKLAAVETAKALLAQRQAQSAAAESLLARGEGAKIAADIARAELAAAAGAAPRGRGRRRATRRGRTLLRAPSTTSRSSAAAGCRSARRSPPSSR